MGVLRWPRRYSASELPNPPTQEKPRCGTIAGVLLELVIENYAVVDRLRIRFHPGLNLLTGETGSGKSIVVDALGLLFGGRASADVIRSGSERARISGLFAISDPAGLDLPVEDGELLIEREILA